MTTDAPACDITGNPPTCETHDVLATDASADQPTCPLAGEPVGEADEVPHGRGALRGRRPRADVLLLRGQAGSRAALPASAVDSPTATPVSWSPLRCSPSHPLEVGATTTDPLQLVTMASNSWGGIKRCTITERMASRWPLMLGFIAATLPHVKGRVSISLGDYRDAEQDSPATYFVDPPYQTVRLADGAESVGGARGKGYAKGCNSDSLDFGALGQWVQSLEGHVIAVDQMGADWLPFKPLKGHRSSVGTMHLEAIWTRGGEEWLEDNQLRYDDHDTEAAANAHAATLRTRRKTPITYVLSNFERNPA